MLVGKFTNILGLIIGIVSTIGVFLGLNFERFSYIHEPIFIIRFFESCLAGFGTGTLTFLLYKEIIKDKEEYEKLE
jgi:hypothetical protein